MTTTNNIPTTLDITDGLRHSISINISKLGKALNNLNDEPTRAACNEQLLNTLHNTDTDNWSMAARQAMTIVSMLHAIDNDAEQTHALQTALELTLDIRDAQNRNDLISWL